MYGKQAGTPKAGAEKASGAPDQANWCSEHAESWVGLSPPELSTASAEHCAQVVRHIFAFPGALDPAELIHHCGWRIQIEALSAKQGGQDALLIPQAAPHRFLIVVDPELSTRERWMVHGGEPTEDELAAAEATRRFRLAHEIGHTLFFDRAIPPRRLTKPSPQEEQFCDSFARYALLPGPVPLRAQELVFATRQRGASLELMASALVERIESTAVIAGILTADHAHVNYSAGLPPMPTQSTFRWPRGWDRDNPMQQTNIYWPVDHPSVHGVDAWTDGDRFLAVLALGDVSLKRTA